MANHSAYAIVVFIWSTTPLAVKWSSESLSPMTAACARLVLAALVTAIVVALFQRPALLKLKHWRMYAVASLGIFPGMPLIYFAAQFIPSGMISMLFALSPFLQGIFAIFILGENPFNIRRLFALLLALSGLGLVCLDGASLGQGALVGVLAMLVSTAAFSLSSVLIKKHSDKLYAFEQSLGSMVFALPGFLLLWAMVDGNVPDTVSLRSGLAVLYLVLVGSLLGFFAFFYVLKHYSVSAIGLIPLLTPVMALWLGHSLAGESVGLQALAGSLLILTALMFYDLPAFLSLLRQQWQRGSRYWYKIREA